MFYLLSPNFFSGENFSEDFLMMGVYALGVAFNCVREKIKPWCKLSYKSFKEQGA